MKFLVHELEYAIEFLYKLKLVDFNSRMRTRFIKILSERFQQYKEEYFELVKEHSNLDNEGNPIIIEEGNSKRYDIIDADAFNKALFPLLEEEFFIEVTDNNRKMLKSVSQSVLNCGIEFEGQEQFRYDSLCEKLESLDLGGDKDEN